MPREKKRQAVLSRRSSETDISVTLNIDGTGGAEVSTPIGFFTHMLESFARHGRFDLKLSASGDLYIDQHHLLEDCGLMLGRAFNKALGDKSGINRAGFFIFPMDEALAGAAADLSGRPFLQYEARFRRRFCGELDTDVLCDFFQGFATGAGANVALKVLSGRSDHHKIEALFKAVSRALHMACSKDTALLDFIPSSKGVLDDWNH
ncbi:MAG: imidazoleglycerol-phosphate dehydratase HisB [Candidatus Wallbacteria bacterium]|nr:imidazoleglycerol-phosphate dehydratase HisB [Candidatus Wallbacteria bacterium]